MINDKILHNANKVAFLVKQYSNHTLTQIIGLLGMPSIDINTAIWAATELGYITEIDQETQRVLPGKNMPEMWDFGPNVTDLMQKIEYAFSQLAKKEQDLEENYVSNWTLGYDAHDVLIALAELVNTKILGVYQLTDPKDTQSTYTFYSLFENSEQMWGQKQFKEPPTGEEVPTEPNTPESPDESVPGRSEAHDAARIRGDDARAAANDTTTTTTVDPDQTKLI